MLNEIRVKIYIKHLYKNDDVKQNVFHYQLNQNTGCKVKFVANMNRQPKRVSNRHHRHQSE